MMNFSLAFTPETIAGLSAGTASALWLLTGYRHYITRVLNHKKDLPPSSLPSCSIVIYSNDSPTQLSKLLPVILNQQYPAPFEVIVVNDGCSEETKDVFNHLSQHYRNLYLTFIPSQAHSLSRRKLAMTLGVKAAKNDIVVFTNAEAIIKSQFWLAEIAGAFNAETEVVISHAAFCPNSDTGFGCSIRRFDNAASTAAALSSAIKGNAFRANNFNMAFRKSTFFNNKGFSRTLNLHGGDDDIFISEISNKNNTAVVLSPDSMIECDFYLPAKIHSLLKISHMFTRRFIKKSRPSSMMMGSGSLTTWLWLISTVATILLGYDNATIICFEAILAIILWSIMGITWNKIGKLLSTRINGFMVLPLMLYRPIYNFYYRLKIRFSHQRFYTWT